MAEYPAPLSLFVIGAAGRMGRAIVKAALGDPRFALSGGLGRADSPDQGRDLGELAGEEAIGLALEAGPTRAALADVAIDVSNPAASLDFLRSVDALPRLAGPLPIVLGVTGFSAAEEELIAHHAQHRPILKAANFSRGVNLLLALVEIAARKLGPDWDIEISETHHRAKMDAPSGTALAIGGAAAAGRGAPLEDLRQAPYDGAQALRRAGAIGFSVRRAGGVIGEHEAMFAQNDEAISLSHRAFSRDLFARGALAAALWLAGRGPGLYGMRDLLGL